MESAKTCTSCGDMATKILESKKGELSTYVCSKNRCARQALHMINIVESVMLNRRASEVQRVSGF